MNIVIKLLVPFFIISLLCIPVDAFETRYTFPNNISIKLTNTFNAASEKIILSGEIKSKLGTLKNISIFFECSNDLRVNTMKTTINKILQNNTKIMKIIASPTGHKAGPLGSWIKMRIQYLPDYKKISEIVTSKKYYPDQSERLKLINATNANKKIAYRMTDASRLFLSTKEKK